MLLETSFPRSVRKLVRTLKRTTPCEDHWSTLHYPIVQTEEVPIRRLNPNIHLHCGKNLFRIQRVLVEFGNSQTCFGSKGKQLLDIFNELMDEPILLIGHLAKSQDACALKLDRPEDGFLNEVYDAATDYLAYVERAERSYVPIDKWRPSILHTKCEKNFLPIVGISPSIRKDEIETPGIYIVRDEVCWRIHWKENPTVQQIQVLEGLFEEYYKEISDT